MIKISSSTHKTTPRSPTPHSSEVFHCPVDRRKNLARSARATGDVGALGALLAASDRDARPLPVGAAALTAEDVDVSGLGSDAALDLYKALMLALSFLWNKERDRLAFEIVRSVIGTPVVGVPVGEPFS